MQGFFLAPYNSFPVYTRISHTSRDYLRWALCHDNPHNPYPGYVSGIFNGLFFVQCETPESRFYKALRIVVKNPGIILTASSFLLFQQTLNK